MRGTARLLDRAWQGRPVGPEEVLQLLTLPDREQPALLEAARSVAEAGHGRRVTFSPNVFIPLTRWCRDTCAYCVFRAQPGTPGAESPYMEPDEVLRVAEAGARWGCAEALFVLGERPEQRYPEALRWLRRRGFASTVDYLCHVAALVLERTGLLPHVNAGILSSSELSRLREVAPSMGLMLESSSLQLTRPGGPHHLAPSKHPRARLGMLARAGRLRIPFTTGLLVGIGEGPEDRARDLLILRELHRRYGHLQEVILQNFQPKPGTPMAGVPAADPREMLRVVAVARLVLGPQASLQVPPNLSPGRYGSFLRAGINDWGGVSPLTRDEVNPEAPWPHLAELEAVTRAEGFELRPRLGVYPAYLQGEQALRWLADGVRPWVQRLADEDGYLRWERVPWSR